MSVPLTPSADRNWITARWACWEESMARSLTVISLLLQSTTYCHYRVYTKFLLTYTAIYRGNRKFLPLGITALQPQSHFHLGTPYRSPNKMHMLQSLSDDCSTFFGYHCHPSSGAQNNCNYSIWWPLHYNRYLLFYRTFCIFRRIYIVNNNCNFNLIYR